ncbi:MAG TPA: hypothetical protein VFL86_12665, partial [Burkholderiaceae bacterium]|nr:hypothetical protein [Burkholderiaceae bacterium]
DGEAAAGVGVGLGLSGKLGAGVEANLLSKSGWRVEFENGKPVALTGTMKIKGDAAAEHAHPVQEALFGGIPADIAQQFKQHAGFDPRSLSETAASSEASVNVALRIPITAEPVKGGSPVEQLAAVLKSPSELVTGPPAVSAEIEGSAEVNDHGVQGSIKVENLRIDQLGTFVERASQGDLEGAFAATGLKATASFNTYEDESRGWLDHGLDARVLELEGTNYIRRVDDGHHLAVQSSTDGQQLEMVG